MNRQQARNNLLNAVRLVVDATKTVEHFTRVLTAMVWDLYRGDIEESDFVDGLADLVQEQLTRAWNEGMRENDLDPVEDMEPEWQTILDDIILNEYNYVDGFAADIVAASDEQLDWGPLLSRAELWANRYNDVVNRAVIVTGEQKLIWILGATEKHCETCAHLNGIVAFANIWEESGVRPQGEMLNCGGWQCDCSLIPTADRQTRNALEAIEQALSYSEKSVSKGWVTINGNHVLIGEEGDEGGGGDGEGDGSNVLYHGTSAKVVDFVMEDGLQPGSEWFGREASVYATTNYDEAFAYASKRGTEATQLKRGAEIEAVVFEITPPSNSGFIPDTIQSRNSFMLNRAVPKEWITGYKIYRMTIDDKFFSTSTDELHTLWKVVSEKTIKSKNIKKVYIPVFIQIG